MKARDILEHFLSRADWVNREKTVDRIIAGDPDKEVRTVLVTWISSFDALRAAVERGFDMLLTHEPTFYGHWNDGENAEKIEIARRKKSFVEENGLVVLRNHDVWDKFPEIGIPWAWARFLGLGEKPAAIGGFGYQHRYDIEPLALQALSERVAARTATIGEPVVQVVGDPAKMVSRVGAGTGCGCSTDEFQRMGCDVSIVCDDGSCYWANLQAAADAGHPFIRVNHGTSEEPGMATLTTYINENLSGVRAEHLPHGSCFRQIGTTGREG